MDLKRVENDAGEGMSECRGWNETQQQYQNVDLRVATDFMEY